MQDTQKDRGIELGKAMAVAATQQQLPRQLLDRLSSGDVVCAREGQFWDFKRDFPSPEALPMAEVCKDIAGFFNAFGGFLIFGVEEVEKDLRFSAVGLGATALDMQKLKGLLEKYLSVVPDISYEEHDVHLQGRAMKIAALCVPKRGVSIQPAKFLVRGPEKKSRPIFDADQLAVRRGDQTRIVSSLDDWQLVSGVRDLDTIGLEIGQFDGRRLSPSLIAHNLPTRSAICRKFIGRRDVLALLWGWLNDDFQYCRVIAGDGGKGKTSLAYEFATQVAKFAPCGFTRIVWLTAKRRQFHAESNDWQEMHETHFSSFRSLLEVLADHLGHFPEEIEGLQDTQLNRLVRQNIEIQPTLFVLDDLDSLDPDDQKRTLEFASQVGRPSVRFLLTTRSNASYSTDLCLKLRGLDERDFYQLVDVLLERYEVSVSTDEKSQLHGATGGSPLLLDSVLRLIRRGLNPAKAIREWKGAAGEDARKAVLQKEIDLLSPESKRVLLCIAYMRQCSRVEVQQISALPDTKLSECLSELESLFLVDAPKIIRSEPRYEMGSISIALVVSQASRLALDHVNLEKRVKQSRERAFNRIPKGLREQVGRAVSQAIALAKASNYSGAIETVNASLVQYPSNADLLLLRARLRLNAPGESLDIARKDLRAAHSQGCRKPLLFDLWLQAEQRAEYGQGIVDVCNLAIDAFPDDRAVWAERRAEGFVRIAITRAKSSDFLGASEELGFAADELHFVLTSEEASDVAQENLQLVHEKSLTYLRSTTDGRRRIELVGDMVKRGDHRMSVFEAALTFLRVVSSNPQSKSQAGRDWVAGQCRYFAGELKRLRNTGLVDEELDRLAVSFASLIKV